MMRKTVGLLLLGAACLINASGQSKTTYTGLYHVGFDDPEGWALKYFTSATMVSGLPPEPQGAEQTPFKSITLGLEEDWLPTLSAARARVGFAGTKNEDLNKAPVLVRPVVRVALPWQLSVVVTAPPPFTAFGITPRLFALGFERPIFEQGPWRLRARLSGQTGFAKGAFTCPHSVLSFAPGSDQNPTGCIGESSDKANLRYVGAEVQASYRIPGMRKLSLHAAEGINFVDSYFQVNAALNTGDDHTRLWTRGKTFTTTFGASYLFTDRVAFTVDGFYTPLWVQRDPTMPVANDGLFNVRALVSYSFR
jgi:hypothetical protein